MDPLVWDCIKTSLSPFTTFPLHHLAPPTSFSRGSTTTHISPCSPLHGPSLHPACVGTALAYQVDSAAGTCVALATARAPPGPTAPGSGRPLLWLHAGSPCGWRDSFGDLQSSPRSLHLELVCASQGEAEPAHVLELTEGSAGCVHTAVVATAAGCAAQCPRHPASHLPCGGPAVGACVADAAALPRCACFVGGAGSARLGPACESRPTRPALARPEGAPLAATCWAALVALALAQQRGGCRKICLASASLRRQFCSLRAYCMLLLILLPLLLSQGHVFMHVSIADLQIQASDDSPPALNCDPLAPLSFGDLPPLPPPPQGSPATALPPPSHDLYITIVTADHAHLFARNWAGMEVHLLRPFDDHLLLAAPESSAPALASLILTPLRWERVMDLTPPQRAYPARAPQTC